MVGGHRTNTPIGSIYSGVVSLTKILIVTTIVKLNDLEVCGTNIGNTYLESATWEKVVFEVGIEFGELAGHLLQIVKVFHGLKSSGKRWHDRLHDILRDLRFMPSKAEEDIWVKDR
jgi:uncharacterized metal-binding protein